MKLIHNIIAVTKTTKYNPPVISSNRQKDDCKYHIHTKVLKKFIVKLANNFLFKIMFNYYVSCSYISIADITTPADNTDM